MKNSRTAYGLHRGPRFRIGPKVRGEGEGSQHERERETILYSFRIMVRGRGKLFMNWVIAVNTSTKGSDLARRESTEHRARTLGV